MRRFFALPALVLLLAIGLVSPYPLVVIRPGLIPNFLLMYFSTLSARRWESFWLCALLAVLAVWPEISPLALGKYIRKSPTVFSSLWYSALMSDLSLSKLISNTAG